MTLDRFFNKDGLSETMATPYVTQAADNAHMNLVDELVEAQRAKAKAQEPTHNYVGAASDVANGFIHEALQPTNWMAAAAEGGIAGGLFRMAPPALRGLAVVGGIGYGAYQFCDNAPKWKEQASTVVNESSYRPEEVQKAHAALENLGGGAVDLIAGFNGLRLGAYAPEATAAGRKAFSGFHNGEIPLRNVGSTANSEFSNLIKNVDWMENPWWLKPKIGTAAADDLYGLKPAASTHRPTGETFYAAPRAPEGSPAVGPTEAAADTAAAKPRPRAIRLDKPGVEVEETRAPFDLEGDGPALAQDDAAGATGRAAKRRPRAVRLDKPGVVVEETPAPFDAQTGESTQAVADAGGKPEKAAKRRPRAVKLDKPGVEVTETPDPFKQGDNA